MKILHVLNGLGFGGAELWLLEIVKYNKGKVQIDFLLTGGLPCALDEEFQKYGSKLFYVRYSRQNILNFVVEFNKIVVKEKYDVVHDHEDFVAGWHWLLLLPNLPPKRIAHAHNSLIYVKNYSNTLSRKIFYSLGQLLNGLLATHITGTSDKLLNQLVYGSVLYKNKRIEPLYCGSDTNNFKYDPIARQRFRDDNLLLETDKVIVFIGRIDTPRKGEINHKNPLFALKIAKEVVKKNQEFKFFFIGEKGELGLQIEDELLDEGLSSNIKLLGKRSDISNIMSSADILLLTPLNEPFGLVFVEAQFVGLKIITSDIITSEVIEFEELFKLINVGEDNMWIEALLGFDNLQNLRLDFLNRNQDTMNKSRFSIFSSYDRLLKYYNS